MNEQQNTSNSQDKGLNTGLAIVTYFIFFIPFFTESKDDPFIKFHMKQSLLLAISALAVSVLGIIPVLGWILAAIAPIFLLILWVMGLINAANGKMQPVPVIGKYAEKLLKF